MILEGLIKIISFPVFLFMKGVFAIITNVPNPVLFFYDRNQVAFDSALNWFYSMINFLDPIVPAESVIFALTMGFGFYGLLFVIRMVSFILRKIPLLGIS
jgi:hypothetical protein